MGIGCQWRRRDRDVIRSRLGSGVASAVSSAPRAVRRRALLVAATALALGALCAPASATPSPAFPRLHARPLAIIVATNQLEAGEQGELAIQVTHRARCTLVFTGPRHRRSGPYPLSTTRYGVWRWRVPADATGGAWNAVVGCHESGSDLTARTPLLVAVTPDNHAGIAARRSMHAVSVAVAPIPRTYAGSGKGGGGYPDDGALCKWTGQRSGACPNYDWGYPSGGGRWSLQSGRGFAYRNCTDFVAWFMGLTWGSFHFPAGVGNAADWMRYAGNAGLTVTARPSVGDIAWWGSEVAGGFGHVAIVTAVAPSGTVTIAEYNGDGQGNYDLRPNVRADKYLHRPPASPQPPAHPTPSQYIGHIVQWDGDRNAQKTAWLVGADARRYWIPTIAMYWCLKQHGAPGPDVLSATTLDQLPDSGQQASCSGGSGGKGGGGGPETEPQPLPHEEPHPPPPPPPTWREQETPNHPVNTFTNYHNASGLGPPIAAGQWVDVYCKVYDPTIPSVNPDGYWSGAYYSPANTFMNGDPYGGPYTHNTDFAVPNC
jgi:surface antigen